MYGSGKTAIITGSSRGIGSAIAMRLAKDGFAVVINYVKGHAEGDRLAEIITASGGRAIVVQADVSVMADVVRLFDEAEQAFGGVDVLVNNAGVSAIRPIADSDDELYDRLFNINVRGTLNGLRQAAKRLRQGGRIINFSSTAVAVATPGMGIYLGSKAAVETISRVFAKELRGKDIRVNVIAPGLVRSEMFSEGKTEEQIRQMAGNSPLERLGEIEEIAGAVAFLAGPDASWTNGQILRVNGGVA